MPIFVQIGLPLIKPQDFKINPLIETLQITPNETTISDFLIKTSVLCLSNTFNSKLEDKERL
jgi:hypothetical protein